MKTLDQYFDRIVILSLPGAEIRAERALRELRDKNLSEKAQIVRGIDGKKCPPPKWWPGGGGSWGCMRAHANIVEEALMDGIERLLVLEDDCVWQNDSARLVEEFMTEVPNDWGQIYFGGQHRSIKKNAPTILSPRVLRVKGAVRTHAYALHARAMGSFYQHILHAPDYISAKQDYGYKMHVDHQLERAHNKNLWKTDAPTFWLAGQGENFSHIRNRHTPGKWWHYDISEAHKRIPLVIADRLPTEEEAKFLHFGGHLHPSIPTIDVGLQAQESIAEFENVAFIIAREAYEHQNALGIHAYTDRPRVMEWFGDWRGPVVRLSENPDLAALCDYVVSKSIPHPWINPPPPDCTGHDSIKAKIAEWKPSTLLDLGERAGWLSESVETYQSVPVTKMEEFVRIEADTVVLIDSLETMCNGAAGQVLMFIAHSEHWKRLIVSSAPGAENAKRHGLRGGLKSMPIDVEATTLLPFPISGRIELSGNRKALIYER